MCRIRAVLNKRSLGFARIRLKSRNPDSGRPTCARALVLQDYASGAMNLLLRGRLEIAIAFSASPLTLTRSGKGAIAVAMAVPDLPFRRIPSSTITSRPERRELSFRRSCGDPYRTFVAASKIQRLLGAASDDENAGSSKADRFHRRPSPSFVVFLFRQVLPESLPLSSVPGTCAGVEVAISTPSPCRTSSTSAGKHWLKILFSPNPQRRTNVSFRPPRTFHSPLFSRRSTGSDESSPAYRIRRVGF